MSAKYSDHINVVSITPSFIFLQHQIITVTIHKFSTINHECSFMNWLLATILVIKVIWTPNSSSGLLDYSFWWTVSPPRLSKLFSALMIMVRLQLKTLGDHHFWFSNCHCPNPKSHCPSFSKSCSPTVVVSQKQFRSKHVKSNIWIENVLTMISFKNVQKEVEESKKIYFRVKFCKMQCKNIQSNVLRKWKWIILGFSFVQ